MTLPSRAAGLLLTLVLCHASPASAQLAAAGQPIGVLHVASGSPALVQQWDAQLIALVQSQDLVLATVDSDSLLPDRYHEYFRQLYRGIPVEGGGLSRQTARGAAVSILGTLYTDIDLETTPVLGADAVAALLRQRTGVDVAFGQIPALVIVPRPFGGYALAYRVTMNDQQTHFVDAGSGATVRVSRERREQSAVGVGTGALGDVKKISTSRTDGGYRTEDTLRPAGVHTFDTRASTATLDRIMAQAVTFASDYATDADNSWTDARVVDAHVHAGWAHDYFAKRFNWRGMDGVGSRIVSIVHRLLTNNAFFSPPPFGPNHLGGLVFGETTGGRAMTSLDTVAHELMHSVTHNGLVRRTGQGLGDALDIDRIGPSTFVFGGHTYPCATSVLEYQDGTRRPFVCEGNRYVLVSNHSGAADEAFADMFGTSAEFFLEAMSRPADYQMGEDILGPGPFRRLDNPAALSIGSAQGSVPYPDHVSRRLLFPVVVVEGTEDDPRVVDLAPIAFVGDTAHLVGGDDSGGVHWNSTVLSHAFYLSVEGGRNQTSGITVVGVGAVNREQIERVYFRAMTQLMPRVPNLSMAAAAVRQAAADLFSGNTTVTRAVSDGLTAVGLP